MKKKPESVKEFLERGGVITKVAAQAYTPEITVMKPTTPAPVVDLGMGQLLYSDFKKKKMKKRRSSVLKVKNVDPSLLPAGLLQKLSGKVEF